MILKNEFVVEAPVDRAWSLLDEVDRVIVCMPGASYIGRDGDDHKVSIKVKVGAITVNFQGTVRFLEKNDAERTARIRGAGKDLGGKASATATIGVKFEPLSAERTRVLVETDLAMTGRLAQFGGGIMADIASRMIEQFSQNLHAAVLARSAETSAPVAAPIEGAAANKPELGHVARTLVRAEPAIATPEPAPLDLGAVLAKRLFKYGAIIAALVVLAWLIARAL